MVALSFQPLQFQPITIQKSSSNGRREIRRLAIQCGITEPGGQPAPMGQKTKYKDGFFEMAFMNLFARKMEKFAAPVKNKEKKNGGFFEYDFDSFVDVSKRVVQGRSRKQQQEVVREVLLSMLPPGAPAQVSLSVSLSSLSLVRMRLSMRPKGWRGAKGKLGHLPFRKLFPPTKWAAEFNAALTVPFFHWLVGPSEVVEVEVNGVKQRSGVHIKKCRYLENSGCVGMCVNMCKIPTQDFFTNDFGLPLTMNPNFEDMSCEMIYGQTPPPLEEDPVIKQPCFKDLCSMANTSASVCPKLQT